MLKKYTPLKKEEKMFELDGISVLKHSSIKIKKQEIIYIDPFQIDIPAHDADLILCTHSHYDHFSPEDIRAVANENTILIVTEDCKNDVYKTETGSPAVVNALMAGGVM